MNLTLGDNRKGTHRIANATLQRKYTLEDVKAALMFVLSFSQTGLPGIHCRLNDTIKYISNIFEFRAMTFF